MVDEEQRLIDELREALDAGAEEMDVKIRERLMQARVAALQTPRRARWRRPAGGLALGAIAAALAVSLMRPGSPEPELGFEEVADFELLTANEGLELYRNLDFYRWLEEEHPNEG